MKYITLLLLSISVFAEEKRAINTTLKTIGKTEQVQGIEKFIKKRYNLKHIGIVYATVIQKKIRIKFTILDLKWNCEMEKGRASLGVLVGF